METINIRRFFRNRVNYYAYIRDSHCVGVHDGCRLTLRQLCDYLAFDPEPFPLEYEPEFRRLCGKLYPMWCDKRRTYGDVVAVLSQKLAEEEEHMAPVA
ncbi:hypothetical protein [Agrobacterium tumefaciens]|uniref:hypothetical protein n=1 Tax=Agrobacterium tumefaciens TaxID=358 RepID=UPI0021D3692D|nr:hypothetical protein [Agrobacterium tumefaciens]UXS26471.1 hypothetical protein FY153_18350 [Agrobacterium tumefaciens]UXS55031.1 hypothetical protein FY148_20420 [Agrobacterium tumefaciens]UXS64997.1 hypothetical protein FY147_18775 [Agrobacterium tumefaciens]